MREAGVQSHTRLALARMGALPMRNNVGVAETEDGRPVRYGLMNSSKQENEQFKSSDLIAPVPMLIQAHHVGRRMAIFGAFETKHPNWRMTPSDDRAIAQLRFMNLVRSVGGMGDFVTDASQVDRIVAEFSLGLTPGNYSGQT